MPTAGRIVRSPGLAAGVSQVRYSTGSYPTTIWRFCADRINVVVVRSYRLALTLLVIAAPAGFAADSLTPEYYPPGTRLLIGVSLRSVLNSPLVKSYQSDMQKFSSDLMNGGQPSLAPILQALKSAPASGFNPFQDLDQIVVASNAVQDQPSELIVFRGRFDANHFPGTPVMFEGVPVWTDAKQPAGAMALVDETTAILGEPAEVRAAIARRTSASKVKPLLLQQARSLASRYDFWGVGDPPASLKPPTGTPADAIESVDHFEFGAALRQGLEISGQIHARTPQAAGQMAESIKMIEAMLKSQPTSPTGTKLDLQSSNGTIRLSILISEEDIRKGIEAQKASLLAAKNTQLKVQGSEKPPAPSRPTIVKNDHGDTVKLTLPGGH